MSTFTDVKKQIANMKERVRPRGLVVKQTIPFDFSVLTPDEQVQLQAFLDQVEPKYHWTETGEYAGYLILDKLSAGDFDTLDLWSCLIEALKRQDTRRIQAIRDRLRYTDDEIFTMFTDLAVGMDAGEVRRRYSPYGDSHSNVLRSVQRGSLSSASDMWLWLVKAGKVSDLFHPDMLLTLR